MDIKRPRKKVRSRTWMPRGLVESVCLIFLAFIRVEAMEMTAVVSATRSSEPMMAREAGTCRGSMGRSRGVLYSSSSW